MSQRADCSAILFFVQITGNVVIAVAEKYFCIVPEVTWELCFRFIRSSLGNSPFQDILNRKKIFCS